MAPGGGGGGGAAASAPQKHLACDECRYRKIACSKEPDGCSRCKTEGILCVYSPQKRMGRPRKRRHIDTGESAAAASTAAFAPISSASQTTPTVAVAAAASTITPSLSSSAHLPLLEQTSSYGTVQDVGTSSDGTVPPLFPTDTSLDFLNHNVDPNVSYIDLLPDDPLSYPNIFGTDHDSFAHFSTTSQDPYDASSFPPLTMNGADLLDGIKFDEPDPSMATISQDISHTLQHYSLTQYSQISEPTESSPGTDSSNCFEAQGGTPPQLFQTPTLPRPNPSSHCGCLSSLYLALDSLARLPQDIPSAMRVARDATKIAHDVVNCPYCYDNLHDLHKPPPMNGFQNVMFLAALLPSACNAYASILQMVDTEVESAKIEGRTLWFSFKEYGGLWNNLVVDEKSDTPECRAIRSYNNKHLSPEIWGTSVRAILRTDVYGFRKADSTDLDDSALPEMFRRRGLKDVITLLDERNQRRHDLLDGLVESGQLPSNSPYLLPGGYKPCPPEQRSCVRMLDMARTALSNLVIS